MIEDIFSPETLKRARKEAKLSQEDLAELSNVSRSTIAKYETSQTSQMTIGSMEKISSALYKFGVKLAIRIHPSIIDDPDSSNFAPHTIIEKNSSNLAKLQENIDFLLTLPLSSLDGKDVNIRVIFNVMEDLNKTIEDYKYFHKLTGNKKESF